MTAQFICEYCGAINREMATEAEELDGVKELATAVSNISKSFKSQTSVWSGGGAVARLSVSENLTACIQTSFIPKSTKSRIECIKQAVTWIPDRRDIVAGKYRLALEGRIKALYQLILFDDPACSDIERIEKLITQVCGDSFFLKPQAPEPLTGVAKQLEQAGKGLESLASRQESLIPFFKKIVKISLFIGGGSLLLLIVLKVLSALITSAIGVK